MKTIEPTRIDRAIAAVAPGWAVKRLRARHLFLAATGGYIGARRNRRATQSWTVAGGDADADIAPDLAVLRARSRDLERNAPLATGALATVTTNVVGTGLRLQPEIDREMLGIDADAAARWERDAARAFALWSESKACDVTGEQDFNGMQALAFHSTLLSGDIFAVKRFVERPGSRLGYTVQLVEADRVDNPRFQRDGSMLENGNSLVAGVERDADGRAMAYHIRERHPGHLTPKAGKWSRMAAYGASGRRNVLHLHRITRPGQARGVPYLAPVVESLKQLDQYTEAERMAAVVSAMFTVFVKSESAGDATFAPATPTSEVGGAKSDDDYKLGTGAILTMNPNESIETANPGRPNDSFDPFVTAILRQVAAGLELPYELIVKHFTSSYSASRAALLEAWKFFRMRRAWLAREFCQPCYEDVIEEFVARGILAAPGFLDDPLLRRAWLGAKWIGPAQGQLDPLKEVKAARERVEGGFSTEAEETAAMTGGDWDRNVEQRAKELATRKDLGIDVAPPPQLIGPPDPDADPNADPDEADRRENAA